ncbi:MAG: transposase [Cyanobacteria bacterium REEB65]|nr:transposase [Cyanobacteria bacterium REEB65]
MAPNVPKNRLGLISPGIGRLASALIFMLGGLIALFFNRQVAQSLLLLALMFVVWGGYRVYRGVTAPHKEIECPQCGRTNEVLAQVREFSCLHCGKPMKLVRKA